ncbi:Pancreatic lipase-related protein 2 [Halotydeus destructor]|nr:Pancreatic lipase-related protein 2 [Halotydeus destructor]
MSDEPARHLGIRPYPPAQIATRFALADRNTHRTGGGGGDVPTLYLMYLNFDTFEGLSDRDYDMIYFITHDFAESFNTDYVKLKNALLDYENNENPAVIIVDWKAGSMITAAKTVEHPELDRQIYGQAAVNAMVVGREVGLVSYLLTMFNIITRDRIHYIGLGVGAHVMHFAGRWFTHLEDRNQEYNGGPRGIGKIGRITGLDPSARYFQGYGTAAQLPYLNAQDAEFVDIIHTSAVNRNGDSRDINSGLYGMSVLSGHVDVYPNGGQTQPFCEGKAKCSHLRSLFYFIASLSNDTRVTQAMKAFGADTYQDYLERHKGVSLKIPRIDKRRFGHFLDFALDADLKYVEKTGSSRSSLQFTDVLKTEMLTLEGYDFSKFPSHDWNKIPKVNRHHLDRPACGKFLSPPVAEDARVHFGLEPYVKQFPWNVCIVLANTPSNAPAYMDASCSASLIAENFVITAAHCFDGYATNEENAYPKLRTDNLPLYLMFGNDCHHPVAAREVVVKQDYNVFIHPDYKRGGSTTMNTDCALIRLTKPIDNELLPIDGQFSNSTKLNTICWRNSINYNYKDECETIYFAGYGINDDINITDSEALRWTVMNFVTLPNRQVRNTVTFSANAERHQLRNTCSGDSGGPFFRYVRSFGDLEQLYDQVSPFTAHLLGTLIGGTSESCTYNDDFSSLNKVGQPEVYNWIKEILANKSDLPTVELKAGPFNLDPLDYFGDL